MKAKYHQTFNFPFYILVDISSPSFSSSLIVSYYPPVLCRYIRCRAVQYAVGFSNRFKFRNFLIGNNAIIHVPLY